MSDEFMDAIKGYIAEVLAEAFRKKTAPEPAAQASATSAVHWNAKFPAAPIDPTPIPVDPTPVPSPPERDCKTDEKNAVCRVN